MEIGGLQKLTLIDYPGKLACTVFLIGCNFRCPWCYNPELVLPERIKQQPRLPEKEFFQFLKAKKGLLEAVVVCGGEPTINKDLPNFLKKIKKIGYLSKLDTNGSNPEMLKNLVEKKLIDYVALDIKAPKRKYSEVAGKKMKVETIEESLRVLRESKMDFGLRTTLVPGLLEKEDILEIAQWISPAPRYILQGFKPAKTIDPAFEKVKPYPEDYLLEIQKLISPFFEICEVR